MEVDFLIPKAKGRPVLAESRLPHPQHFGVEGYRRRNVSDCKNKVIKMRDHSSNGIINTHFPGAETSTLPQRQSRRVPLIEAAGALTASARRWWNFATSFASTSRRRSRSRAGRSNLVEAVLASPEFDSRSTQVKLDNRKHHEARAAMREPPTEKASTNSPGNSLPASAGTARSGVLVRSLHESELATVDHIMRLAFGTFVGLADPTSFMGDAGFVRTRWKADPSAAFAAEINNEVVGSNFATNWGSVGFFGPLTIRPDLWDKGLGKRLMEPIIHCFDKWQIRHAGLFTFAHSPKHVGLYQKFGFHPRFLTAVMSKPVEITSQGSDWTKFSDTVAGEQEALLNSCRELTDAIYEGLDLEREIRAVAGQALGDTGTPLE